MFMPESFRKPDTGEATSEIKTSSLEQLARSETGERAKLENEMGLGSHFQEFFLYKERDMEAKTPREKADSDTDNIDTLDTIIERIPELNKANLERGTFSDPETGHRFFIDSDGEVYGFQIKYKKDAESTYLLPDHQYTLGRYTYETDAAGRICRAYGSAAYGPAKRDPVAQRTVGGLDRAETDNGGHVIACEFGGDGGYGNLVPFDARQNQQGGRYRKTEALVEKGLKDGNNVSVDIKYTYNDDFSRRPNKCTYTVEIDKEKRTYQIPNGGFKNE